MNVDMDHSTQKQILRKDIVLRTATRRPSYFSRAGNQSRRESVFNSFFREHALRIGSSQLTTKISNAPTPGKGVKTVKPTSFSYFPAFYYASTPFIRLKTRRRGSRRKRLKQKLAYITPQGSVRQGFRLFAKTFRSSRHTSKNGSFRTKFSTQRDTLVGSTKRISSKATISSTQSTAGRVKAGIKNRITSPTTGASKTIRDLRDELHRRGRRMKMHRVRRARRLTVFRRYIRLSRKRGLSFEKFKPRYRVKLSRSRRSKKLQISLKNLLFILV